MLFVAAPGPHAAESEKVWTLQTATSTEFENDALCKQAYGDILKSVEKTDTITIRAWCFPNNANAEVHTLTSEEKKKLPKSIQLPTKP
jgi:hypothetical protein